MKGTLSLKTAPVTEPVSVTEAKAHMRIDATDEDAYIATLITTARKWIEDLAGICMLTQTWYYYLDAFPKEDVIAIPIGPVTAVSSVEYTPDGGTQTSFSSTTGYETDLVSLPARVALQRYETWPTNTLKRTNGVCIEFVAGYGAADGLVAARASLVAAEALVAAAVTAPEIAAAQAALAAAAVAVTAAETAAITAIPEELKSAVKILAAFYYENRSAGEPSKEVENTLNRILKNYRMWQRDT